MAKDREWLKQRLCTALGWDEVVVEGVVEAIASAESADDVDALVQVRIRVAAVNWFLPFLAVPCHCQAVPLQDYMGGGAQPKQLVQEFVRAQGKGFASHSRQVANAIFPELGAAYGVLPRQDCCRVDLQLKQQGHQHILPKSMRSLLKG